MRRTSDSLHWYTVQEAMEEFQREGSGPKGYLGNLGYTKY